MRLKPVHQVISDHNPSDWLGCHFWLGTELIAALLLAPLTVLGELPPTKSIDDNATMVLFPLVGLVLILPFL